MKKIVIVGGGIAGLSAGIYACKAGFETEIYEKNLVAGGNCSGWRRGDYYIDNCLHWMTGTKPDTPQYQVWRELGALSDEIKIIERESFYVSEYEGQRLTLWRDIDRTEKEMLELSPEDEKEITRFIRYVKFGQTLQNPSKEDETFKDKMTEIGQTISPVEIIQGMMEYGSLSLRTLADKFQHPLIKRMFLDFMANEYESYWLMMAYSFFIAGNGDLPEGGSTGLVDNLVNKFKELGGVLHLGSEVDYIVVNKKRFKFDTTVFNPKDMNYSKIKSIMSRKADGIMLADGTNVGADYVVCAGGIHYTFNHLLSHKYMPKRIKKLFKDKKEHHIYSSYQVAFAVDGEMPEVNDTLSFDCEPLDVGRRIVDRICVKNYRIYGDYIAPKGKTVIQVSIVQYKEDFKYWEKLNSDRKRYYQAKINVAKAVQKRIEDHFPQYIDRIRIIDAWTPMTYYSRNYCEYGAYMRYITTVASTKAFLPCTIKGLSNVFLASHSLKYPGGIPTAAMTGKKAIEKIQETV